MSTLQNDILYEELREWLGGDGASWNDIMRTEEGQAYIMSVADFYPDHIDLVPVFLPERFQDLDI